MPAVCKTPIISNQSEQTIIMVAPQVLVLVQFTTKMITWSLNNRKQINEPTLFHHKSGPPPPSVHNRHMCCFLFPLLISPAFFVCLFWPNSEEVRQIQWFFFFEETGGWRCFLASWCWQLDGHWARSVKLKVSALLTCVTLEPNGPTESSWRGSGFCWTSWGWPWPTVNVLWPVQSRLDNMNQLYLNTLREDDYYCYH